jgi:DnaJ family protein C protein 14
MVKSVIDFFAFIFYAILRTENPSRCKARMFDQYLLLIVSGVVESVQVEQAWSELTELLAQLQQKVEAAANTIRCSACGLRHKRIKVDRPCYAARNCSSCKIHHSAREGDIWAEARCFGFLWHYYACMEGNVYDITEWAGCQKDSLKHLRPDSHQVQYRIALGKQASQPRRHSGSLRNEKPPDLENLLNTLYGQTDCTQQGAKRRNKKANK